VTAVPDGAFTVRTLFDYGATFVWALSGALIAARRGYDVFGLAVIALVSATGGGLLRDGLFLQSGPPAVARTPDYLLIVVTAVLLVYVTGGWLNGLRHLPPVVQIVDALALGAYAVVGVRLAVEARLSLPAAAMVGVINAVGGSILRDVLMRRELEVCKPGTLMALAALASTIVYLVLGRGLGVSPLAAGAATVVVAALVRAVSLRYDVRTRAMPGFGASERTGDSARADSSEMV
jgi:uncharacterized membrane protein YeiH